MKDHQDVLACLEHAIRATRDQDIEQMIRWLGKAVAIYEENPSAVHSADSRMRDLLVLIRTTKSLCQTLKRPHDDVSELEARADRLRTPLH